METMSLRDLCDIAYATLVDLNWPNWAELDERLNDYGKPVDESAEQRRNLEAMHKALGLPPLDEVIVDG